ncbi:hypothetical protein Anas_05773 [Armadillidium nasatum]|uniref:Uncharacterized protein n=1 Tax=Armadillidium nasatum TaxID=96803 RepID=A0A5N5T4X3_9CRUS|nr:hypothetical protein Anas_05773 [Armadillidium nasatum]
MAKFGSFRRNKRKNERDLHMFNSLNIDKTEKFMYNVPPPNYRVSPYPSHPEEHIAYSQVPQREEANRDFNDHYLREYPHSHQQQRLQEHQTIQRPPQAIFTPHPEVQDFLSFRDPPTNIRAPEEGQSLRHYNVGFQLSTETFPNYNRQEKYHESKEQDNSGIRTSNEQHNESKAFLPYYEDYANHDYYGNEEYVEVPTDNTSFHSNHEVLVDAKDHDSSSIFYNNERKEQEVKETPTTESQGNRPKNLASLLAGMVNLRNIDVTERNWGSSSSTEHLSSTSTTIPANPESSQTNENDYYYYGELYDEFADLYLNNEKETGGGEDNTSKTDESSTEGKNENWRETSSTSLSSSTKAEESITSDTCYWKHVLLPVNINSISTIKTKF